MADFVSTQDKQTVSVIELLPKINPDHEAFFRKFVPSKYLGEGGHRDLSLVSIRLEANGDTVAVYEVAEKAQYYTRRVYVHSFEYRIIGCQLVEKSLGKMFLVDDEYRKSRAAALVKYGHR